jgi:uncharacterized protein YutE (UPF0331/DUF86 family)
VVDPAKLDQMLANLRLYTGVLRELAASPKAEFLANRDKIGNAKYHFVIANECCIDIVNHVIASENLRFPKDNADGFTVLAEHGVVQRADEVSLRSMAQFRNRLVHLYWDVADERVYEYLQYSLTDLERFAETITGHAW